ncbi:hypothetical protein GCM10009560_50110 [Nonomuraea longicatena]|uniref:Uncharacterized protein n=1 Tax=Nonomuraea longicatena TaxID=83682 RepID=A0ABN1Q9U7_9ACTN
MTHHMTTYCTTIEPNKDTVWPVRKRATFLRQGVVAVIMGVLRVIGLSVSVDAYMNIRNAYDNPRSDKSRWRAGKARRHRRRT